MPFDATPQTDLDKLCRHDEVLRVLVEADRLLSGPEKWCKGDLTIDGAICFVGALRKAGGILELHGWEGPAWPAYQFVQKVLYPGANHNDPGYEIAFWNDADARTFADVKDLFARAIRARQEVG